MNLHLKTTLTMLAVCTVFGLVIAGAAFAPQTTAGFVAVGTIGACIYIIYQVIYTHYKMNQK